MSYAATSQITSYSPAIGCPNSTHNLTIRVTNNYAAVPSNVSYTVNLFVKTDQNAILKTFNGSYSGGFALDATQDFLIVNVPFGAPMTCTISGTISVPIMSTSYDIPAQNYVVAYPLDLVIAYGSGNLTTSSVLLTDYAVRYYLDGNYDNVINQSASGTYQPTVSGSYTAKVYVANNGCLSQNPSNAAEVVLTSVFKSNSIAISVYPNPVTSSLTIEAGSSLLLIYELIDMNGLVVRTASFQKNSSINTEDLKAGSYLLNLKDGNENIASYKLVK